MTLRDTQAVVVATNNISEIVRSNNSESASTSIRPPIDVHANLLEAWDHFNARLYNGRLPDVVFSFVRKHNVPSHFTPNRFQRADGTFWHEVQVNPLLMGQRSLEQSLETLAYEATRVARYEFGGTNQRGGKGSNGYHDKTFAKLMKRVGLYPSDTGLPGGTETGTKMSWFVIDGGLFDRARTALMDHGFTINWHDRLVFQNIGATELDGEDKPTPKKDRVKFSCLHEDCGLNAWAKPTALIRCHAHDLLMLSADAPARQQITHLKT